MVIKSEMGFFFFFFFFCTSRTLVQLRVFGRRAGVSPPRCSCTLGTHYALDFGHPRLGVAAGLSALPLLIPIVILLMRRLQTTEVQLWSVTLLSGRPGRRPHYRLRRLLVEAASTCSGPSSWSWSLIPCRTCFWSADTRRPRRIISRNAKPSELRLHEPTWIGRVRHKHDLAAARPEAAKRLGGFLEGHESIVDDAPDVHSK